MLQSETLINLVGQPPSSLCKKCHKHIPNEKMYVFHYRRNIIGWKTEKEDVFCIECAKKDKRLRSRIVAEEI
jgi:NAD-dependent SIR2 family protein deacetylase